MFGRYPGPHMNRAQVLAQRTQSVFETKKGIMQYVIITLARTTAMPKEFIQHVPITCQELMQKSLYGLDMKDVYQPVSSLMWGGVDQGFSNPSLIRMGGQGATASWANNNRDHPSYLGRNSSGAPSLHIPMKPAPRGATWEQQHVQHSALEIPELTSRRPPRSTCRTVWA